MNLYEAFTVIKHDHLDLIKEHEECLVPLLYDLVPEREKDRKLLRVAQQYGVITYYSQGDKETMGEWLREVRKTLEEDAFMAETWIRRTMTYLLYVYGYSDNTPESAFDSVDESKDREEKKQRTDFYKTIAPFCEFLNNGELGKAIAFANKYPKEDSVKTTIMAAVAAVYMNDFLFDGMLGDLRIDRSQEFKKRCKELYNLELAAQYLVKASASGFDYLRSEVILSRLVKIYTLIEDNAELSKSVIQGIINLIRKKKGKLRNSNKKALVTLVKHLMNAKKTSEAGEILFYWRLEGEPDAAFIEGCMRIMTVKERTLDFYAETLRIYETGAERNQVLCMVMAAFCLSKMYEDTKKTAYKVSMRSWLEKAAAFDVETAMAWLACDYLKYRVNCESAVSLLHRLMALNYAGTKDVLAVCYLEGLGVDKDEERAADLITQGTNKDINSLAYDFGNLYALFYLAKTKGFVESAKAKKEIARVGEFGKYSEDTLLDKLLSLTLTDIKDDLTEWSINVNGR